MPDPILFAVADGVATITLNRPDKLNAFNDPMRAALRTALDEAAENAAVRTLIVTGAGRGFCSGQDLGDRAVREGDAPRDLGQSLRENYNPLVRRLRGMAKPVVMAVNGVAAGAGANFALSGDIVVAARSARFVQVFARIGVIPDCGGTYHLPRLVGHARAMGLALLAEPLPAETAAEWGLIWKCVEDDALMDEAGAIARRLADGPPMALAAIKRAIQSGAANGLESQLELEAESNRALGFSEDYHEAVHAFLEKRRPVFRGR